MQKFLHKNERLIMLSLILFTVVIVGVPAMAAVKAMPAPKSTTTKITPPTKPSEEEVKQHIQAKLDAIAAQTLEQRKQAILKVLNTAEKTLLEAQAVLLGEADLPTPQYLPEEVIQNLVGLSDETKQSTLALIDESLKELNQVEADVANATNQTELVAARQAAVDWLIEYSDDFKAVGLDIYVETLQSVIAVDQAAIVEAKLTVVKYNTPRYLKDTSALEAAISLAESSVNQAVLSIGTAAQDGATPQSLATAGIDTINATADVYYMEQEKMNLESGQ